LHDYLSRLDECFRGKVAVVTGGANGIGATISAALAAHGAIVCVADKDIAAAEGLVPRLGADRARAYPLDVSNAEEVSAVFRWIVGTWGRLDILVNNAGCWTTTAFAEVPEAEWDAILDTNLKGTFLCAQAAFAIMKERREGAIVNLSSSAARSGGLLAPGWWNSYAHYAASKAAIESLTRSVALEGGPYGIRVNAVAPGPIVTETMEQQYSIEARRRLEQVIPLGRLGRPEDIANAILLLASPHASYVTGKTLDVNGGLLMD